MLVPNAELPLDDFSFEFKRSLDNNKDLIVSISSGHGFAFHRMPFDAPVIFIEDKHNLYYMRRFKALCSGLNSLIAANGFDRVLFVGISKAGWASLALAHFLASRDPGREYRCLAFSPQTRIWPRSSPLPFPSYRSLIERSKARKGLRLALEKYGHLPELTLRNLIVNVYYGALNRADADEAQMLSGSSVALFPLLTSSHLSHLSFVFDASNRGVAYKLVNAAMNRGHVDGDTTLHGDSERFVDELVKIGRQPSVAMLARALLDQAGPKNA